MTEIESNFLLPPATSTTSKGASMTMAEIFAGAYLTFGLVAVGTIWTALIASKRRDDKVENISYDQLKYSRFGEPNTKPSRSHP
jgi:hypothetical protein